MSLFLDVILIVVMVMCVVYGHKNGFFKSVMGLISGVLSAFVAYTFMPALAAFLKEKVFLDKISKGIADAFASAAKVGGGEMAGGVTYDFEKMLENPQITAIAERYGVDSESLSEMVAGAGDATYETIQSISENIAASVTDTVSNICAFIIIFVVATIVLKIFTVIIGGIFSLPVLKSFDRGLGIIAGVIAAIFFAWVISVAAEVALSVMVTVTPDIVTENTFNNTIIMKFFAENSIIDIFSKIGN